MYVPDFRECPLFDIFSHILLTPSRFLSLPLLFSPLFVSLFVFFGASQAECRSVITDVDPDVAMAGYVLMLLSVYFSFLLVPAPVRSFRRDRHRIYLGLAVLISLLSLVASILFFVAAGEVTNQPGVFWSIAQSDFVITGVQNMNAVFFFLGAIIVVSEPFGHAALFYLASYYIAPLLPALNKNSLEDLVNPAPGTNVLSEDTFIAASALGYTGIVLMALFLLHRFRFTAEHNEDEDDKHAYDEIRA
jgi:hypothetical protein